MDQRAARLARVPMKPNVVHAMVLVPVLAVIAWIVVVALTQ